MKLTGQLSSSDLGGVQIVVNSYSVSCRLERETGRTFCATRKGQSWEIRLACPWTLLSGFEELMLVRIPSERARGL
jgi:hypothetical protein